MLAAIKRGDRMVTGGGIVGVVQRVPMVADENRKQVAAHEISVEIAPNIRVIALRDTITSVIRPRAANGTKSPRKKGVLVFPIRSLAIRLSSLLRAALTSAPSAPLR